MGSVPERWPERNGTEFIWSGESSEEIENRKSLEREDKDFKAKQRYDDDYIYTNFVLL